MRLLAGFFLIFLIVTACSSGHDSPSSQVSAQSCDQLTVVNQWVVKYKNEKHPRLVKAPSKKAVEAGSGHGRIEWIEANYILPHPRPTAMKVLLAPSRNEEEIYFQNEYLQKIGAFSAWNQGDYGEGITVAVVDSGVDIQHPRLKDHIAINAAEAANNFDDDQNGYIDDLYGWNFSLHSPVIIDEAGHGTHIAGIIAADHSTDQARGIAPRAHILPVDFVAGEKGDEFSALQAVQYAIDRKANIINNSWSSVCSVFLKQSFERWQSENIVFVSSAGNNGQSLVDYPLSPANLDLINHITVGSFGFDFNKSSFSNTGPSVYVLAPGEMILGISPTENPDQLVFRSGTSMSAAFVSGAIAVAWGHRPELTAQQIVETFKDVHRASTPQGPPKDLNIRALIRALDKKYPP